MRVSVAIIGAGFSGTLGAIHLAESATIDREIDIYLIEARDAFGRGLAYSPPSERFKLNVRTKAMGAFPDDAEGFYRWLKDRIPTTSPDSFAPRLHYGDYLCDLLTRLSSQEHGATIHRVRDEATDVRPDVSSDSFVVVLKSGRTLKVDACILAIGNVMQSSLGSRFPSTIFRTPFESESYADLPSRERMLIIGSGLTAVDVIIEAEARGFTGSYTVLSRHGRFPRPHEDVPSTEHANLPEDWERRGSVRALVSMIRAEGRRLGSSQPVFEAMRSKIQSMWRNFSQMERRRFLRHVRPFWDNHRHRIPPEHAALLSQLQSSNRLDLIAGRVVKWHDTTTTITTTIAKRGAAGDTSEERFDVAFLCIGPEGDLRKVESPLVKNLIKRNLISPGPLKLGATSERNTPRLWVLGPLQREDRWEITAVRELREEAKRVAQQVTQTLFPSPS